MSWRATFLLLRFSHSFLAIQLFCSITMKKKKKKKRRQRQHLLHWNCWFVAWKMQWNARIENCLFHLSIVQSILFYYHFAIFQFYNQFVAHWGKSIKQLRFILYKIFCLESSLRASGCILLCIWRVHYCGELWTLKF